MKTKLEEAKAWIVENIDEFAQQLIGKKERGRPKNQERADYILKRLNDGVLGREIAKELGVSEGTVSYYARRNGFNRSTGRRKGFRHKGQDARDKKLLKLDNGERTLQEIGDRFGLTRERVRQVIKMNGRRPHREIIRTRMIERQECARRIKASEKTARDAKRMTPTKQAKKMSRLLGQGLTIAEVGERIGKSRITTGVTMVRYRKRWPHLFPYRRKWKGHAKGFIVEADTRPYHLMRNGTK